MTGNWAICLVSSSRLVLSYVQRMAGIQERNQKHIDYLRVWLGYGNQMPVIDQIKSQGQARIKGGKIEQSFDRKIYKLRLNRECIPEGVKHWTYFFNQSTTNHLCKSEQFCSPLGLSQ